MMMTAREPCLTNRLNLDHLANMNCRTMTRPMQRQSQNLSTQKNRPHHWTLTTGTQISKGFIRESIVC